MADDGANPGDDGEAIAPGLAVRTVGDSKWVRAKQTAGCLTLVVVAVWTIWGNLKYSLDPKPPRVPRQSGTVETLAVEVLGSGAAPVVTRGQGGVTITYQNAGESIFGQAQNQQGFCLYVEKLVPATLRLESAA